MSFSSESVRENQQTMEMKSSTDRDPSEQRHAPSPPDSLCPPEVPDGEKGDAGSLHHCQEAEGTHIKDEVRTG